MRALKTQTPGIRPDDNPYMADEPPGVTHVYMENSFSLFTMPACVCRALKCVR